MNNERLIAKLDAAVSILADIAREIAAESAAGCQHAHVEAAEGSTMKNTIYRCVDCGEELPGYDPEAQALTIGGQDDSKS